MILGDLSEGTLFNEVYGDETSVVWRVVRRDDELQVAFCSIVGSRSRSDYKPYCLQVFLFPTQQTLF